MSTAPCLKSQIVNFKLRFLENKKLGLKYILEIDRLVDNFHRHFDVLTEFEHSRNYADLQDETGTRLIHPEAVFKHNEDRKV